MEAKTPTKAEQILNTVAGEDTNLMVWVMSGDLEGKLKALIAAGYVEGVKESAIIVEKNCKHYVALEVMELIK